MASTAQDDFDRENEGDLIGAAALATPASVAAMLRDTTGVVCTPMLPHRAAALALPRMCPATANGDPFRTAFTVTVDSRHGTTTGISASDRAATIRALADDSMAATDFSRPGHVFPLLSRSGGVLERAGHTEAGVDLCVLAGVAPVAFLCEVCDHTTFEMTRLPGLLELAQRLALPLISVADLQRHRLRREVLVEAGTAGGPSRLAEASPIYDGLQPPVADTLALPRGATSAASTSAGIEGGDASRLHEGVVSYVFSSVFGPNRYVVSAARGERTQDADGGTNAISVRGAATATVSVSFGPPTTVAPPLASLLARSREEGLLLHVHVEGDFATNTQQPLAPHLQQQQGGGKDAVRRTSPPSAYSNLFPPPPFHNAEGGVAASSAAHDDVCDRVTAELAQVIAAVVRSEEGARVTPVPQPCLTGGGGERASQRLTTAALVAICRPTWPSVVLVSPPLSPLPRLWEYGVTVVRVQAEQR